MNLRTATAPTSEPVTLTEAKAHLRVDISTDDTYIGTLIQAAREEFENRAGRTCYTTTYRLVMDEWPCDHIITLPRPPLASVTSIVYKDDAGASTTYSSSNYIVDVDAWPGRIVLKDTAAWPSATLYETGAIVVTYVAGYSSVASIPARHKQGMLMLIGHWYENRESVVTSGAIPKSLPMAFETICATAKLEIA